MIRLFLCSLAVFLAVLSIPANAKVQCSCPKVPADGEGNTSCSASESKGRCNIDFNLFGAESESRAAELVAKYGDGRVTAPNPTLGAAASLTALSNSSPETLLDAVLIYMTVAAGNQSIRAPAQIELDSLREVVKAIRSDPLAKLIREAFNRNAQEKWSTYSDGDLRTQRIPIETMKTAVVSPGCIEVTTTGGLWMMFKAAWSPARITPRCGIPSK